MTDTLRIKRRHTGAIGAPTVLTASELAFNEVDNTLYYGSGDSGGNATNIIPIAGRGAFLPLTGGQLSGPLTVNSTIQSQKLQLTNGDGFNLHTLTQIALSYQTTTQYTHWITSRHLARSPGRDTGNAIDFWISDGTGSGSFPTNAYLNFTIAGDAITAAVPLYLGHDPPTIGNEAATKNYVDNHAPLGGPYLPLAGGTVSGAVTLSSSLAIAGLTSINNALNVTNGVFSCYANSQTVPAPAAGLSVFWNFSGGSGEVNFFNTYTPAGGGRVFTWNQVTGTGTQRQLASLGPTTFQVNSTNGIIYGVPGSGNAIGFNWNAATADVTLWVDGGNAGNLATKTFLGSNYLPLTGGTVTGATTFSAAGNALTVTNSAVINGVLNVGANTQSGTQIAVNGAAASSPGFSIRYAGSARWFIAADAYPETGGTTGNGGAGFALYAYNNDGSFHGTALQIARDTFTTTFSGPLGATTFSGDASFNAGIDFGSATAPLNAASDLSRHIALYAASYGFSITGSRLNHVCGTGAAHYFVAGSSDIGYINSAGLNMPVGAAGANTGAFTTLSANSTVNFNAAGLVTLGTNTTLTMTNAAIGYDGDGVSTSANDLSLQSHWGVGFQNLNVAAQQVPGGLYGAFIDARTGNVSANRIFVTDTAGSSQIQNLRFTSTTADQVIEAFPTWGYATGPVVVVSGGTGWAVNDRAYDANKNFYTVTAVSGGVATSVAINTRASTTAIPTNPITLTAGPLPVSSGTGLTVNISYTSSTRLVLQHTTGAILLNSANGTQVTGPLTLDRDPTAALGAATKQYVDSTIVVSDTAPTGVRDNTFWFDSSGTGLYLRFNDGTSTQWVLVAGAR